MDSQPRPLTARLLRQLPNALSAARLVLGLAFPLVPPSWRLAVVLAAALTDLLDGTLCRLLRAATPLGRVLDPLADKVFLVAVILTLLADRTLGVGQAVLLGLRDVAVVALAGWALLRNDWAALRRARPSLLGKATTAAQFACFLVLLLSRSWATVLILPAGVLSGLAGVEYLWLALRPRGKPDPAPPDLESPRGSPPPGS